MIMPFVLVFVVLVPVIQVLRRTGHHPAWSLLVLVPGLNLLAAWFFAFAAALGNSLAFNLSLLAFAGQKTDPTNSGQDKFHSMPNGDPG